MVDCSISMRGEPMAEAISVAAALATASRFLPNIRLEVWGWTGPQHLADAAFSAVRVWSSGEPVGNVGLLGGIPRHGTPDGEMLSWVTRDIAKAVRPDERPLVIIASDGDGSLAESGARGSDVVAAARRHGVGVVSVALGDLKVETQARLYGEGNYISWQGSVKAIARPLGDLIARVAAGRK
jgi:hypothetical protein